MQPRGRCLSHIAAPLLQKYSDEGCPVDVGRDWTADEIWAAVQRGPHPSALHPDAIAQLHSEVQDKEKQGFVKVLLWDDIKHKLHL